MLDALLVDAAAEAGVEVRQGFPVDEVLVSDGRVVGIRGRDQGRTVTERAAVVVGADGRHSLVARAVRPEQYHEKPPLLAGYYAYWSSRPTSRPGSGPAPGSPASPAQPWPTTSDV